MHAPHHEQRETLPAADTGCGAGRLVAQRFVLRDQLVPIPPRAGQVDGASAACGAVFFPAEPGRGRASGDGWSTPKRRATTSASVSSTSAPRSRRQRSTKSRTASVHLCARLGPGAAAECRQAVGRNGRSRHVEGLATDTEGGGHLGNRPAVDPMAAQQLVANLEAIPLVEERVPALNVGSCTVSGCGWSVPAARRAVRLGSSGGRGGRRMSKELYTPPAATATACAAQCSRCQRISVNSSRSLEDHLRRSRDCWDGITMTLGTDFA